MKKVLFLCSIITIISCGGSKNLVNQTKNTSSALQNNASSAMVSATSKKTSPITTFDHQIWNDLLNKYVSDQGNVDYKSFKQNIATLNTYLEALGKSIPSDSWDRNEKLAYWLNVYNAFTVKLIVDHYPISSIKEIKNAWNLKFFKLEGKAYNLEDVEHQILRKMNEPRIHFGINCASFSCPALSNKAFTAANVNEELQKLTINFINNPKYNKISDKKVELSKIFSWFAKDFKKDGSLIDYLNKYSTVKINSNAKKSFMAYDWKLNQ